MATIHVDGKTYDVQGSNNLLEACLSLGLDIPYFCWHPKLGSVGACRQCAVKQYNDANDTRGRLVMSCMTPAADNTFIAIADDEAKAFRKSVIEWLMTNHPHDCPVCAEGGHCHLQDMTVMTEHNTRRYRFEKRTHLNQYLGPFIKHEMNRCIACYRCDRYYKDYAGGSDFGVYGAHDNVYFGRTESGVLESEFSGNLTEVCPTGVFTDKTHADHYTRKWDMQYAPSICQNCAVGCNTSPGERYGEVRRIENRYNGAVNHYFLCDRGRFGYGFVNRKDRPHYAQLNHHQHQTNQQDNPLNVTAHRTQQLHTDAALDQAALLLRDAKRIAGIGSPRASLETNFALQTLVGKANFCAGFSSSEQHVQQKIQQLLLSLNVPLTSLRDIEAADAAFILGEDITQTAPRIALAVRQAAKNFGLALAAQRKVPGWNAEAVKNIAQRDLSPIFITSVSATRLDDIATQTYRAAPDAIARLGFAVAHIIDANAPAVPNLTTDEQARANDIAQGLLTAQRPLIISGTGLQSVALLDAAANVAAALKNRGKNVGINLTQLECNSLGVTLLTQGNSIQGNSRSVEDILTAVCDGIIDTLVIAENNLYRRAPQTLVDAALAAAKVVIVLDHQFTRTAKRATLVLPAASFAEADGTLVNLEGRAQRFFQVYDPAYYQADTQIHEGWRWLHALHSVLLDKPTNWSQLDDVIDELTAAHPFFAAIRDAAPKADFRVHGLKIARESRRYSGRTAMRANLSVHEPRASQDIDSALAYSMEGISGPNNPSQLIPFANAPGWNSPQAWNKFQDEVGGSLRAGDPGVRLIHPQNRFEYSALSTVATNTTHLQSALVYHLFGSEEQSARAPVVKERIPAAYVAISSSDAQQLGLATGQIVNILADNLSLQTTLLVSDDLATGLVAVPVLKGFTSLRAGIPVQIEGVQSEGAKA
jgi:NADH-quinone oxidoreductase subunit G